MNPETPAGPRRVPSPAALALRAYLRTAPPCELAAGWAAVKAMGLRGPTLAELIQQQRAYATYLPLACGHYDA